MRNGEGQRQQIANRFPLFPSCKFARSERNAARDQLCNHGLRMRSRAHQNRNAFGGVIMRDS